jgi:poly(A) polymerase Pap1
VKMPPGINLKNSDVDVCIDATDPECGLDFDSIWNIIVDQLLGNSDFRMVHPIRQAKVPIVKFNFKSVPVDLSIMTDVVNVTAASSIQLKSRVLGLIPEVSESCFQSILTFLRIYAKRGLINGANWGFIPGCAWIILLGKVFLHLGNGKSMVEVVQYFFQFYASYDWTVPIQMEESSLDGVDKGFITVLLPDSSKFPLF